MEPLLTCLFLVAVAQEPDATAPPADPEGVTEGPMPPPEPGSDAAEAGSPHQVEYRYRVVLKPSERVARVRLEVRQEAPGLRQLRLHYDPQQHLSFKGDGELDAEDETHLVWRPPPEGGTLSWTARLDHLRDERSYDARVATRWALFRGTDLVPPAASSFVTGSESTGSVRFELPKRWRIVGPDRQVAPGRFEVETDRFFIRPQGWMLAGQISVETFEIGETSITLATPRKLGLDLMDIRTFLRFTLPTFQQVVGQLPPRILVVGAGDPMWRGGLSGPRSLYLHRDRPLVASDGTSPVLHELMHVFMEAKSGDDGDWIVEGLAELYALNVLQRSGGMSESERKQSLAYLAKRGQGIQRLTAGKSTGRRTARAVVVLDRLDQQIQKATQGNRSLDDVVRRLVLEDQKVTTAYFRQIVQDVVGEDLEGFFSTYVSTEP